MLIASVIFSVAILSVSAVIAFSSQGEDDDGTVSSEIPTYNIYITEQNGTYALSVMQYGTDVYDIAITMTGHSYPKGNQAVFYISGGPSNIVATGYITQSDTMIIYSWIVLDNITVLYYFEYVQSEESNIDVIGHWYAATMLSMDEDGNSGLSTMGLDLDIFSTKGSLYWGYFNGFMGGSIADGIMFGENIVNGHHSAVRI